MDLSATLARQSASTGKQLHNPAATGFSRAHKRKNVYLDTEINPSKLPTFPQLDHMDTEASALNDVMLTRGSMRINIAPTPNVTGGKLLSQTAVAALHGYRTPRVVMENMPTFKSGKPTEVDYQLDLDGYYKTMASAEHGNRVLDDEVLKRVKMGGRGPQGNLGMIRAGGLERDANSSIRKSAPLGLSHDAKTAKSQIYTVAPNHKATRPVLAAARNF